MTVLVPSQGWNVSALREIWQYREVIGILVWRDIKVRYKQTVLGICWAVIQPLFTMIVFSVFFGKLAKVPSDGLPYPIFTYCALLPWQLFVHALTESSNSLVANQNLITKVYFPRLIIPLASVISGLVDFAIAFIILLGLMGYYGIVPTANILYFPLFVLFALITALSVGLWLSALNVRYRDIRYTIPFLTQFWLFATPIAYPSSLVPENLKLFYGLNPMTGVVEGFRWVLLGQGNGPGLMLGVSVATVAILLFGGLYYFQQMERDFADVI